MFKNLINEFPILNQKVNNQRLVYLDSGATTQKPNSVVSSLENYYNSINANPHRGAYCLSTAATEAFENSREKVKNFINANSSKEIIFTKGATEALNLVAYSYGMHCVNEDDEILVAISEHHSNLIPWQQVAKIKNAKLKFLYLNDNLEIDEEEYKSKINENTKILAIAHISNVTGAINPIKDLINYAHKFNTKVVVDAAQSIAHHKVDVTDLDADFLVFSGHKMFAPMGIGILYGKEELLESMPPFLYGGDMVEYVYEQETTFDELPHKFEGGTQNVEGAIGLSKAIDFINELGINNIEIYEKEIVDYATEKLENLGFLNLYRPKGNNHSSVLSFSVEGIHPHDLASILDSKSICVRSGNHCAQPLMRYLGINSTCRASFSIYNSKEDVDALIEALIYSRRLFGYGHE
ncbi:cysteine desulfurase [Clostridium cavendishii DSM 21758]|uniref:cysteine desulfurase n=1 Tax=Clostridium cavendishii DSM 21758 TaxID=1121302 RepID=A0A1M6ACQ7_9CLOT|nr:cysteine desulfurase [Clostridium cavendishii]SHI34207.1 cysteine desulfurase [Clostridium cavendishii DSM 21758]